jgi:hypothetical protein
MPSDFRRTLTRTAMIEGRGSSDLFSAVALIEGTGMLLAHWRVCDESEFCEICGTLFEKVIISISEEWSDSEQSLEM